MGVSSTTNRKTYTGDGVSTSFSFPYYFFAKADIKVYSYDTLLGGTTLKALNTDYTITATANAQGLFASGGSVVYTVAPLSTDIVVIYRDGSEVQNYSLLQNQAISSSALVQQMDYLTLLVQRLEDQVSRSAILKDGTGATFDSTLPVDLALNPGSVLTVNQAGDGFTLTTAAAGTPWQKATALYSDVSTAGTTQSITSFSLPAGYILTGLAVKHSIAFAGTLISAVTASVGIASDHGKFLELFDVLQAVGDANFDYIVSPYLSSWANATNIILTVASTGANLNALTQGSVDIYYKVEKVISV